MCTDYHDSTKHKLVIMLKTYDDSPKYYMVLITFAGIPPTIVLSGTF